jgi:ABC-type branched-subunit amino acid transport system substrate-binding protein
VQRKRGAMLDEEGKTNAINESRSVTRREFLKIAGFAGAAISLSGGLGGLLAACGGGSTATTTAGAGSGASIKILGAIPFSGDAANIGPPYDRAIRMAIDELNAAGIPGFPGGIQYQVIDTETSPSAFTKKLQREVQTYNPDFVLGNALETEIRVECQDCPGYKLPAAVGGMMAMVKYIPPGNVPLTNWVSYYGYPDYYCGYNAGQFFADQGAKKVAFVGGDYDWGYGNGMGLKAFWEENGKPFEIAPVIYTPLDKTDYSTEADDIKKANVDGLFSAYMGAGWFSFPKQLKDAGALPKYYIYDPTYSNLGGAKITGAYGAEGIYTLGDHDPTAASWKTFVEAWRKRYGSTSFPEAYTNNHYQVVYWFIEACKKVGPENLANHDLLLETMGKTSFQNVCINPMGPLDQWGGNTNTMSAIIQFAPGADLDPSFPLHEELVKTIKTPTDMTSKQVLDKMAGMTRLEPGQSYPAGS